jgi:hypothetical protein
MINEMNMNDMQQNKLKEMLQWKDVAGLTHAKKLLIEAILLPQRFPYLFTGDIIYFSIFI